MKELMSLSTCKTEMDVFDSDWAMVGNFLTRHQLDGIELYVDHFPLPEVPADLIVGVHLPYWMGRHRAWLDDSVFCSDLEDAEKIFLFGGLSRGELLANFRKAMQNAKFLDAAYGVFHVAYVELENVFTRSFDCTDRDVMDTTADFLNESVSYYPKGEPPVRLFFENLWWPGLTFLDPEAIGYFTEQLDFDNWAFVLDIGHLMNATTVCREEEAAVDTVLKVLSGLPAEVVDRIEGMHFHQSLSGDIMQSVPEDPVPRGFAQMPFSERMERTMEVVERMDQHMPFTHERCSQIVEYVSPDYLTHEFIITDLRSLDDKMRIQRAALNKGTS